MKILLTRLDKSEFQQTTEVANWSPKFLKIDELSWGQLSRWRLARRNNEPTWESGWVVLQQFDQMWDRILIWVSAEKAKIQELTLIVGNQDLVFVDKDAFKESEVSLIKNVFKGADFTRDICEQ